MLFRTRDIMAGNNSGAIIAGNNSGAIMGLFSAPSLRRDSASHRETRQSRVSSPKGTRQSRVSSPEGTRQSRVSSPLPPSLRIQASSHRVVTHSLAYHMCRTLPCIITHAPSHLVVLHHRACHIIRVLRIIKHMHPRPTE